MVGHIQGFYFYRLCNMRNILHIVIQEMPILAILFANLQVPSWSNFEGYDDQDSGTSQDCCSCWTVEHLWMLNVHYPFE